MVTPHWDLERYWEMFHSRLVLPSVLLVAGLVSGCENSANVGSSPDAAVPDRAVDVSPKGDVPPDGPSDARVDSATLELDSRTNRDLASLDNYKADGANMDSTQADGSTCVKSCAEVGKNCGTVPNGCGGNLYCGVCSAPATCGGGPVANVCGCSSASWTTVAMVSTGEVGEHNSLAIDSSGDLHAVYYDHSNARLMYAHRTPGGPWSTSVLDGSGMSGNGWYNSIAIDKADGVHVSYLGYKGPMTQSDVDLNYAYRPSGGGSWSITAVESSLIALYDTAIALDGKGGIHISYNPGTLKNAFKTTGGAWSTSVVDPVPSLGSTNSAVATDSKGGVHVSYVLAMANDLMYAYRPSGGFWTTNTVDPVGNVGNWSSIAVDRNDGVHIAYVDSTNKDLKYAYLAPGGSWALGAVDSQDSVGWYASLAIDSNDNIHIGYLDETNKDLKYAHRSPGGIWKYEKVPTVENDGWSASVVVDVGRGVHVIHYDIGNEDLRYSYRCPN